jgi:hypothetical protein
MEQIRIREMEEALKMEAEIEHQRIIEEENLR